MSEKIKNFRDLEIWKLGKEIVKDVYRITEDFPRTETYGLISQMRRSAVSIPSNIAEGFNRFFNKEYKQFLFIALGSCAELETQFEIGYDLNFADQIKTQDCIMKIQQQSKMIRNLIKKL